MVPAMSLLDRLLHLSLLDVFGVLLLLAGWQALSFWIEREGAARPSVTVLMMAERREWMVQMVTRQPRIFDATILSTLRQSTTFFASTVVIAIGGVLALIGNAEQLGGVAEELGAHATPVIYQVKLGFVALVLTEAFLKFVWSNRLFGYCAVVMAAVPNNPDHPEAYPRAARAAELNIRAAWNFNRGLRAIYVALAALAWLIGAVALIISSLVVFWVIWSREYRSQPQAILSRPEDDRRG